MPEPVNSSLAEWNPSVSAKGTLYFASSRQDTGRLYKAEFVNGNYKNAQMLEGLINLDDAGDPCIAPDETYLVFSSCRKGGYGGTDLYISHRQENGKWALPMNPGPTINTSHEEVGPRISPDGKYLFFYHRDKWENATYSDIFWVDIAVLKK